MTSVDPLITQLVEARTKAGLSQRALAKAAGTCQSHISDLETGQGAQGPCLDTLRRWARALGLEPVLVPLTYRPGFEDPQTAPVERFNSAVHGAPRQVKGPVDDGAPASPPVSLGSDGDRRDVAHRPVRQRLTLLDEDGGESTWSDMCCAACYHPQVPVPFGVTPWWPTCAVARTLDVAERTVENAREAS